MCGLLWSSLPRSLGSTCVNNSYNWAAHTVGMEAGHREAFQQIRSQLSFWKTRILPLLAPFQAGSTPWKKPECWITSPLWLYLRMKTPKSTLNNKRARVSVKSYPVCASHPNQSASHHQNWSSQNQTEFGNLATQQIAHHLIYHSVPAATCLSKTTNTSALLLVIKPLKNNMRVLVINAWMKIC